MLTDDEISALSPLQQQRRARILAVARRLFQGSGFHATGVDAVMREAGVSKKTLYRYFGSKVGLILTVLDEFSAEARQALTGAAEKAGGGAAGLFALFTPYLSAVPQETSCGKGCFALQAIAEFSGHDQSVVEAARAFKQWELEFLTGLAAEAGVPDPQQVGAAVLTLLDGAMAQQATGFAVPEAALRDMLAALGVAAE